MAVPDRPSERKNRLTEDMKYFSSELNKVKCFFNALLNRCNALCLALSEEVDEVTFLCRYPTLKKEVNEVTEMLLVVSCAIDMAQSQDGMPSTRQSLECGQFPTDRASNVPSTYTSESDMTGDYIAATGRYTSNRVSEENMEDMFNNEETQDVPNATCEMQHEIQMAEVVCPSEHSEGEDLCSYTTSEPETSGEVSAYHTRYDMYTSHETASTSLQVVSSSAFLNRASSSNTPNSSSEFPVNDTVSLNAAPFPVAGQDYFVRLVHIDDPENFYVHFLNEEYEKLHDMQLNIHYLYSNNRRVFRFKKEAKNTINSSMCAALYNDGSWYRAEILDWNEGSENDFIYIKYIDYGNKTYVHICEIQPLQSEFMKLLPFAVQCHLANLEQRYPILSNACVKDEVRISKCVPIIGSIYPARVASSYNYFRDASVPVFLTCTDPHNINVNSSFVSHCSVVDTLILNA